VPESTTVAKSKRDSAERHTLGRGDPASISGEIIPSDASGPALGGIAYTPARDGASSSLAALQRLPSSALRAQYVRGLARHGGNAYVQRMLVPAPAEPAAAPSVQHEAAAAPVQREAAAAPVQREAAAAPVRREDAAGVVQRDEGGLLSLGKDQALAMIGRVSPGLAGLIRGGPMGLVTDKIKSGVQSWIRGMAGGTNIRQLIGTLVSSMGGILGLVTQLAAPTCEQVAAGLNKLVGFAQGVAENPVYKAVTGALSGISSIFGKIVEFVVAPQFDMLMSVGGAVVDGVKNLAHTISGWITSAKNALGVAWTAVKRFIGLSDDEGGILKWITDKARAAWETIKAGLRPMVEPIKQAIKYTLLASPLGPTLLAIKFIPKLVEGAQWLWANRDKVVAAGSAVISQVNQALQAFGGAVGQIVTGMVESVGKAHMAVLTALQTISGIPIANAASGLVQMLSDGLQELVTFGKTTFSAAAKKVSEWVIAARDALAPYASILVQIAMVALNPPMLVLVLGGQLWKRLKDCYKPPIINFLLDLAITYLKNAPNVGMFGPLWRIVRAGVLGFIEGVRSKTDAEKIKISNKIMKMISGGSTDFLIGYAKGLLIGLWTGLKQPFELAYDLIKLLNYVLDWAEKATTDVVMQALAPVPPAAAAAAPGGPGSTASPAPGAGGAAAAPGGLSQTPAAGGPSPTAAPGSAPAPGPAADGAVPTSMQAEVQQKLSQLATELRPPVDRVVTGFLPAVQDVFSQKGSLTYQDVMKTLGSAMATAEDALHGAGDRLAQSITKTLLKDGNEAQIGEETGNIAGQVLFEVILLVITEGWIEALKPLQAVARVLNWAAEAMGEVFRWLGKIGGWVADGAKGLWRILRETGAIKPVIQALEEIGAKLAKYSEELLALLGKGEGRAGAKALEGAAAREAALIEKYGDDARKFFKNFGADAERLSTEKIEAFLEFYKGMNAESRAMFDANPSMWRTYFDMDPASRGLFMLCASPCPANALPEQVTRVEAVLKRLGVSPGSTEYEGMRVFLHRHGATPQELEQAIQAAERAGNLAELRIISTKYPSTESARIAQSYADELARNPGLKKRFDDLQRRIGEANKIVDPAERANKLTPLMDELHKMELDMTERGVLAGGKRITPEAELISDGTHGINWPDAEVKARVLATGNPQGRFASVADVQYAVRQGAIIGPGAEGHVAIPSFNTSRYYTVDAAGNLVPHTPNSYFIKVRPNGEVHAFPSADPPTR
jgi:hypothetical protein